MPTYYYTCSSCPLTLTITRGIQDTEYKPVCANCATTMKRQYDPPPITFKGTGWGSGK